MTEEIETKETLGDIQEFMDQVGYELLSEYHPNLIENAWILLGAGVSADQIQERLLAKHPRPDLLASLTMCAVHYMERHPELGKQ